MVHADRDVYVRLFFFKLPDLYLVSPGRRSVLIDKFTYLKI